MTSIVVLFKSGKITFVTLTTSQISQQSKSTQSGFIESNAGTLILPDKDNKKEALLQRNQKAFEHDALPKSNFCSICLI